MLIGASALLGAFTVTPFALAETPSRTDRSTYVVETVANNLERPWSVAFLPDGRRLVTERAGRLKTIAPDGRLGEVSLSGLPPIYLERANGLLDVVLDPDFKKNQRIYLSMTYGDYGSNGTSVVRARLAGDRIEDVLVIFRSTPKEGSANAGGRMVFLADETLLLTLGDGASYREEAQNPANHYGKLVRIDRDGRAPADNPFASRPGAAPEVYTLGHKNVQAAAIDPANGALLIAEHGARGGDEINRVRPGGNYGWPVVTSGIDYSFAKVTPFRELPGYENPLVEWTPAIAPAGIAVYAGDMFANWRGDLLVTALKEQAVRRIIRRDGRIVGQELLLAELGERMRDVKVAPDGAIYVLTDGPSARLLLLTAPERF